MVLPYIQSGAIEEQTSITVLPYIQSDTILEWCSPKIEHRDCYVYKTAKLTNHKIEAQYNAITT